MAATNVEVLLIARPSPFLRAVYEALHAQGRQVVASSVARAVERLREVQPELVALDAEGCTNAEVVRALHARQVPLAILGAGPGFRSLLAARTLGAQHIVVASASPTTMASGVIEGLEAVRAGRHLPAEPVTTTLSELVETVGRELRKGLGRAHRVPVTGDVRFTINDPQLLATYVRRLRAALSRSSARVQPVACELTGASLDIAPVHPQPKVETAKALAGARVVLLDDHLGRADAMATILRENGAEVYPCATGRMLGELSRITQLDAHGIVLDWEMAPSVERLIKETGAESRLRWTQVVSVKLTEIWSEADRGLETDTLLGELSQLLALERGLPHRLVTETAFQVGLAATGPGRLLRAVAVAGQPARLSQIVAQAMLRVELAAHGVVAGASLRQPTGTVVEGPAALAAFLTGDSGDVRIERLVEPGLVNIFAPVATAIAAADAEEAPRIGTSAPRHTRISWSSAPGPMAGRSTWTSIPAIRLPAEPIPPSLTTPGELLDAVDENEADEGVTMLRRPSDGKFASSISGLHPLPPPPVGSGAEGARSDPPRALSEPPEYPAETSLVERDTREPAEEKTTIRTFTPDSDPDASAVPSEPSSSRPLRTLRPPPKPRPALGETSPEEGPTNRRSRPVAGPVIWALALLMAALLWLALGLF